MIRSIKYAFSKKLSQLITDDRYVFQLTNPHMLDKRVMDGEDILYFDRFSDVSQVVLDGIAHSMGKTQPAEMQRLFAQQARLYVAMADGVFGSLSWVKSGSDIPRWLIPLDPGDLVLNRGFTDPGMRGRGLYSRCITATYEREGANAPRFLTDCHVHNTAPIRQFERTGFEIMCRTTPTCLHSRF